MFLAKLPIARLVAGNHLLDERFGRLFLELEVALHAAAPIEQHDQRNRLDVVGKQRQGLPLAVVVDREILPCQVGDEPASRVGHRRIDRDGLRAGTELRRLGLRRGQQDGAGQSREHDEASDRAVHEGSSSAGSPMLARFHTGQLSAVKCRPRVSGPSHIRTMTSVPEPAMHAAIAVGSGSPRSCSSPTSVGVNEPNPAPTW